ncbi:MAG TPA: aminopeptidase P N-terminal domain-containing protein, partial [Bacteroidales bacterium]|nr:aminopeptidase P N-terminal domain-containing protein [Bacteroidales bacterium]
MFDANVYSGRRAALKKLVGNGIVLFPGNTEAAFNYPSNQYHFRQDSNFLYFFGLDHPDLAGVIDIDEDRDYIFGDDVDMDDIIWMGPQPTMKDRASEVGVSNTHPMKNLSDFLKKAISKGRNIHFTAPYRGETFMLLEELLGIRATQIKSYVSASLTHAVVKLRSVKDELEIAEIEKAIET